MSGPLTEVVSPEAAGILAQAFGPGCYLAVPSSTATAAHIEILIGLAETTALIDAFGGTRIYLPSLKRSGPNPTAPDLPTVERLGQTLTAPEIARKHECSVRCIHHKRAQIRILKEQGQWPPR